MSASLPATRAVRRARGKRDLDRKAVQKKGQIIDLYSKGYSVGTIAAYVGFRSDDVAKVLLLIDQYAAIDKGEV